MSIRVQYINYLETNRKSNITIKNYLDCLEDFCNEIFKISFDSFDLKTNKITTKILDDYNNIMKLSTKGRKNNYGLSSNTITLRFNSLASLIEFLEKKKLIDNYTELSICIKDIIKKTTPDFNEKEILTENELKELFEKVKGSRNGKRRALMLFCLCQLGMRRSEVCNLKLSDINIAARKIRIWGKGNKYRTNTLNDKFIELYNDFILERSNYKYAAEYLFCSMRSEKITKTGINMDLASIHNLTNIKKNLHPHMLRRTYASTLYKKGVSILVIQKLLGHSDDKTTKLYFAIDETDMQAANNKFDIF